MGTTKEYGDARLERCRVLMLVPGPLQTVQRAEIWRVIWVLKAFRPGHLGTDYLNVVRSIGRLLGQGFLSKPWPLVKDEDLISLVSAYDPCPGPGVTKVKGHATDADAEQGRFREEDKLGNAEADSTADLGRRHQSEAVMDARRVLLNAQELWYPIVLQKEALLLIPLSGIRAVGGSNGKLTLEFVFLAGLPVPPGFLHGPWIQIQGGCMSGADIAAWPCSVILLCKFTGFLATLHWPAGAEDMGHFGVSYLEDLILFEQWAGHRLLSDNVTRPHVRAHRPITIPSVPVSEGIVIQQGCCFISSLVKAVGKLPGGLGSFLPCQVGSHMSRLRHLGWEQCLHGLTSRPTSVSERFLVFWGTHLVRRRSFWMVPASSVTAPLIFQSVSLMVFTSGDKVDW